MLTLEMKQELLMLLGGAQAKNFPLLLEEISRPSMNIEGLKVINNTPLTMATLFKCASFLASGADLTISLDRTLPFTEEALKFLKEKKVPFFEKEDLKGSECDIVLDCNGGMVGLVEPKLGFVELTGSGKYKYNDVKKPVINVDDTETKKLETFFGTGESLVRSLHELGPVSEKEFEGAKVVVFGFGKVGRGVVHGLISVGCQVVVIDSNEEARKSAKMQKGCLEVFDPSEKEKIKAHFSSSLAVVTVTGTDGWVSKEYNKEDFAGVRFLANMGAEDEFGPKFSEDDVLNKKFPVNFALKEPTLALFLDPIFLAHNKAAQLLADGKAPKGFHPPEEKFDLDILKKWRALYPFFDVSAAFAHGSKIPSDFFSRKAG